MSRANPLWGAPRIQGEFAKLGIRVAKSTVEKYRATRRKPPSPTWRSFLDNHLDGIAATDFFVVPTATFRVLFVFVVLSCDRRRVVHFNVTAHPSAEWAAQQIVNAFPDASAPRYLMRDRDGVYGSAFSKRAKNMGITEVMSAPRSPWQYGPKPGSLKTPAFGRRVRGGGRALARVAGQQSMSLWSAR